MGLEVLNDQQDVLLGELLVCPREVFVHHDVIFVVNNFLGSFLLPFLLDLLLNWSLMPNSRKKGYHIRTVLQKIVCLSINFFKRPLDQILGNYIARNNINFYVLIITGLASHVNVTVVLGLVLLLRGTTSARSHSRERQTGLFEFNYYMILEERILLKKS